MAWSCNVCTFSNSASDNFCEICRNPKVLDTSKSWTCSRCDGVNHTAGRICQGCGASNPKFDPSKCEICGLINASHGYTTCCRGCALGIGCTCPQPLPPPPPPPVASSTTSRAKRRRSSKNTAEKSSEKPVKKGAEEEEDGDGHKSLSLVEMDDLFRRAAALKTKGDEAASGAKPSELGGIMDSLYSHLMADISLDKKAASDPDMVWEIRPGGSWKTLSEADCLTLDSERRAGNLKPKITLESGERATIDITKMKGSVAGTFRGRSFDVRATPKTTTPADDDDVAKAEEDEPKASEECMICYSEAPVEVPGCGHRTSCAGCLTLHIQTKLKDGDVLPWISCPAIGCKEPLPVKVLTSSVSSAELLSMPLVYLSKNLVRFPEWTPCLKTRDCAGGFLVTDDTENTSCACPVCGKNQKVKRKAEAPDEELTKMMAEGKIRKCPSCDFLTMKEYGICNVINCEQCGIWWNWRTRETGRSSSHLKNKARSGGSLWEPGELHYQQNLQRTDPSAFKELLERNGMEFNPHYVRGT